jgi:hypothetical protein
MNDESNALVVPPEISSFFAKPPLLVTENREDYDALFVSVARTIAPANTLEWLSARSYVDLVWEIGRLRRAKAAIINATRLDALRMVFESMLPEADDRLEMAARMADQWFVNPDERPGLLKLLRIHELDDDAISAHALALRAPELEKIDRTLQQLEISSMAHLREIEFHRRASSWRPPKDLLKVVDAIAEPIPLAPPGTGAHVGGTQ